MLTESPYLSPNEYRKQRAEDPQQIALRSKSYESAIVNLSSNLPLPAAFYQQHPWRIHYNELLPKHQQFKNEYIYAFNWEDPKVDRQLLKISKEDVILTITSAGDNILDYLLEQPKRIHAVDLNPNQNHLLELKVAAFTALPYEDVWKLFGEGRHPNFRELLITAQSAPLEPGIPILARWRRRFQFEAWAVRNRWIAARYTACSQTLQSLRNELQNPNHVHCRDSERAEGDLASY